MTTSRALPPLPRKIELLSGAVSIFLREQRSEFKVLIEFWQHATNPDAFRYNEMTYQSYPMYMADIRPLKFSKLTAQPDTPLAGSFDQMFISFVTKFGLPEPTPRLKVGIPDMPGFRRRVHFCKPAETGHEIISATAGLLSFKQ